MPFPKVSGNESPEVVPRNERTSNKQGRQCSKLLGCRAQQAEKLAEAKQELKDLEDMYEELVIQGNRANRSQVYFIKLLHRSRRWVRTRYEQQFRLSNKMGKPEDIELLDRIHAAHRDVVLYTVTQSTWNSDEEKVEGAVPGKWERRAFKAPQLIKSLDEAVKSQQRPKGSSERQTRRKLAGFKKTLAQREVVIAKVRAKRPAPGMGYQGASERQMATW